ncbi:TRAP transporter substrate-binding protein, partial [Chloroflexota bacterium]
PAEPVVFKMVTWEPRGMPQAEGILSLWSQEVSRLSNGQVTIDWVGGPEVTGDAFEMPQLVMSGAIDAYTGPFFHREQIPEGAALAITQVDTNTERERGFDAYMNELHNQHDLEYVGRMQWNWPFYVATTYPVQTKEDLKGGLAGWSPAWGWFIDALGLISVDVGSDTDYTAMESGVINSMVSPLSSMRADGLFELQTHFIDVPTSELGGGGLQIIANLDKVNSLPDPSLLRQARINMIPEMSAFLDNMRDEAYQSALDSDMIRVEFSAEDAKWLQQECWVDAGWESMKENISPESLAKMQAFFAP